MRLASLLLLLAVLAAPAGAQRLYGVTTTADEFDAAPNGTCSLREAVASANLPPPGEVGGCLALATTSNVIQIVLPSGTYTLALAGADEDLGATGDLDLTQTTPVVIAGADPADPLVIDGGGLDRVFDVFTGADLTLIGLTLRGGSAATTAETRSDDGGCVYATAAAVTLDRVTATACVANDEGGVLRGTGGVTLTVTTSTLDGNTALDRGGAFYLANGSNTALVTRSALTRNTAGRFGGAVQVQSGTTLTVRNSTVSGNQTTDPAGINTGGGIASGGTLVVESSTITGNAVTGQSASVDVGGGVRCSGTNGCSFQNSVVAGNTSVDDDPDLSVTGGSATSLGHNLLGIETDPFDEMATDQVGTVAAPLDAQLGPLADNGGPTRSHLPQPGSPLVGAGETTLGFDQRGAARTAPVDVGSVESDAVIVAATGGPDARRASLALFPNPTAGAATLRLHAAGPGTARVRVLDLQGRLALPEQTVALAGGAQDVPLDASALPAGVYVVQVASEGTAAGARTLVVVR